MIDELLRCWHYLKLGIKFRNNDNADCAPGNRFTACSDPFCPESLCRDTRRRYSSSASVPALSDVPPRRMMVDEALDLVLALNASPNSLNTRNTRNTLNTPGPTHD